MRSIRSPLLLIIAAAAYSFVPLVPTWAADVVGIPVTIAFAILLPGLAVVRIARLRADDPLEFAAHVGASGLMVTLLCAFVWTLTGVSLDAFRLALPVVVVALCLVSPARDATRVDPLRTVIRRRDKRLLIVLAALIVQPVIGVLILGAPMGVTTDTIDHAAYVAEIARSGEPFPTTSIYLNPGPDGEDFRKALLHAVYGFTARHAGVSPVDVLGAYGAFLLLVMILVVYTIARALLRKHRLAAAVAVVFFLVGTDWSVGEPMIRAAFYPNRFGAAFLLLFIASAVEFVHRGPSTALRWCAAYAFAASATHMQYAPLLGAVTGVLVLWRTCSPCVTFEEHLGRSLRVGVAAVVGAGPFTFYRMLTAYQTNPLHEQVQAAMYVSDSWFMADPARLWETLGPVGAAALLCIPSLWSRRRDIPGVGYTIAALVTYLVIQLVPFIVTPMYAVLKYLVFRLDVLAPFYLLPAYMIASRPRGARTALAVVLVAAALVILPLFRHTAFSRASLEAERRNGPDRWARGLYELANALPRGSVVASDPVTSYLMSAFTPYYVVCTLDQHAPPNDLRVEARMSAARDIVSPYTAAREKDRLIREHRVTHVVVNRSLPPGLILNYWTLDPAMAQDADETFQSLRYEFEPMPMSDGITAYRWRQEERLSTLPRPVPRPVVENLPVRATRIGVVAGEARLEGAVIHGAAIVPAGGEVVLDLYWSRGVETRPGTYVVTVRFDRKDLDLPLDGRPFPKVTRKLVERWKGERYRFRADHMIHGGLFGPDAWGRDELVEDDVRITIPGDIAPGRYRVRAKMLRVANQPNHHLRDYLYDDDTYTGIEIGEVTIREW